MKASLRALWLVVWLLAVSGISTASGYAHDVYVQDGILELLPDNSRFTGPITGILWKHGPNKVAEWYVGFGLYVYYYGTFRNRVELNKETGHLVIKQMTKEDNGIYSVEINGRLQSKTYEVTVNNLGTEYDYDSNSYCPYSCSGRGLGSMQLPFEYETYEASPSCPLRFVITTNGSRCVKPGSILERFLIYHRRTGQDAVCICPDQGIDSMHPSLIINHEVSVTQICPGREIVVTTTDGKKPCVNPESNLGNFIYDIRRKGQRDSCKCPDQGINNMNSSLMKDYQIHEASPSCPSMEIIVTTTNGTKPCVNPESDFGKYIYKLHNQRTGHGIGIGVGVGVGVSVFVLILIYRFSCRKKNEHSPTSE